MSKRGKSRGKAKVKQDEVKELDSLAYKVLDADTTKSLLALEDVDSLEQKMREFLKMEVGTDIKQLVVLDYFVSGFWWAKQHGFTAEQTSAFFTVLDTVLENIKGKQLALTECIKQLKGLFVGVGFVKPDKSAGLTCLDTTQAKLIIQYFHNSLFQHYKLYQYMFGEIPTEEIIGADLSIEVPQATALAWLPPLEEGVGEEIYNKFLAKKTPATPSKIKGEGEKTDSEEVIKDGQSVNKLDMEKDLSAAEETDHSDTDQLTSLLSELQPQEIKNITQTVFKEMLGDLKEDVRLKLIEKENEYINKINKIHRA